MKLFFEIRNKIKCIEIGITQLMYFHLKKFIIWICWLLKCLLLLLWYSYCHSPKENINSRVHSNVVNCMCLLHLTLHVTPEFFTLNVECTCQKKINDVKRREFWITFSKTWAMRISHVQNHQYSKHWRRRGCWQENNPLKDS